MTGDHVASVPGESSCDLVSVHLEVNRAMSGEQKFASQEDRVAADCGLGSLLIDTPPQLILCRLSAMPRINKSRRTFSG